MAQEFQVYLNGSRIKIVTGMVPRMGDALVFPDDRYRVLEVEQWFGETGFVSFRVHVARVPKLSVPTGR